MNEEELKEAQKILNRRAGKIRWKNATLRDKLMQGEILRAGRLRWRGLLMCTICRKGVTRDKFGRFVHAIRRHDKDHQAKP